MVLVESVHSESVPFGSLNPTEKLKTPNGEPKPENFCGFHKFISYIVSDVGKFAEFDGEIIIFFFKSNQNGRVVAGKNGSKGVSRHAISTGMYLNSSYTQCICTISVAIHKSVYNIVSGL